MRLQTRITVMVVAIVLLSASVTMALTTARFLYDTDRALERNLFNIAEAVAKLPVVAREMRGPPVNGEIQRQVQGILDSSADVDLIVVCNQDSRRYSHPNPDVIGATFVGGDQTEVVERGKRYISTAKGTLGVSIRAFVPVVDGGAQLGFVVAGTLRHRVENAQRQMILSSGVYLVSGLVIGVIGAVVLARKIKRILLDLEPGEIARLYREHRGMLGALHEGVVAIDAAGNVSLANESARQLLEVGGRDPVGGDIEELMPGSRLREVMATGEAEYDREQQLQGRVVIINRVPIVENGAVVGAVATFRDKTLLVRLAEELTGARQLVEALRASSHEFLNKLQVLLGLMDLGKHDRARDFILDTHKSQREANKRLMHTFREPIVAGLMLGKASFSREQGVVLAITPESYVEAIDDGAVVHALVTVIGNLIDNAVEAAREVPDGQGRVAIDLREEAGEVRVEVRNNGRGIAPEYLDEVFGRGFSTKGEGRGTGLFLVRQDLESVGGSVSARSDNGETVFVATIPLPPATAGDGAGTS